MKNNAHTYRMRDWKETTALERPDGCKTTRVEAEFAYEGELAGIAKDSLILNYLVDQTGTYLGWEHFEGTWQGQAGTIIFRIEGSFDPHGVDARVVSQEGSGTGSLAGLRLAYSIRFEGPGPYSFTLSVE